MRTLCLTLGFTLTVSLPCYAEAAEQAEAGVASSSGDDARARSPSIGQFPLGPCEMPVWGDRTGCRTPRPGFVSGGYMALDFGLVSFDSSAAERAGVGVGPIFQVRFGAEFWDQFLAGVSLGTYSLHDKRPFSETVINCQEVSNVCGDPSPAKSSVATGFVTYPSGDRRPVISRRAA